MASLEIDIDAFDRAHDLAVKNRREKDEDGEFVSTLARLLTEEHEKLHREGFNPDKFRKRCAEILGGLLEEKRIDFLIAERSRRAIRSALETGLAARSSVPPPRHAR